MSLRRAFALAFVAMLGALAALGVVGVGRSMYRDWQKDRRQAAACREYRERMATTTSRHGAGGASSFLEAVACG